MRTSLVIKGTREDAERETLARAIPFVYERSVNDISVGYTELEDITPLMLWFTEPSKVEDGFGFPPGTLLLYTFHDARKGGRPRNAERL